MAYPSFATLGKFSLAAAVGCLVAPTLFACATDGEARRVRSVAASTLDCPSGEFEAGLHRETPAVREWYVGCDFAYTRVHCNDSTCAPAPVKPPCIGDLPCFEEDPLTLAWRLREPEPTR